MHNWSTIGARTNHRQTQIYKIHHGPDLGETSTFPHIVFFVLGHGAYTQLGSLEILKIGTLVTLEAHDFFQISD